MKVAQFWARFSGELKDAENKSFHVSCRAWSNDSLDDAASRARERAMRIVDFLSQGKTKEMEYGYPGEPLPEPCLQELLDPDGKLLGILTRNSYGALILNSPRLMFVDIDLPDVKTNTGGLSSLLGSIFGTKKVTDPDSLSAERAALERVEQVVRSRTDWAFRVYRTRGGLRLMLTSVEMDPKSAESKKLLADLSADPLYQKLCLAQECYRARLSPKPWRCEVPSPPGSFPFKDSQDEAEFQRWLSTYTSGTKDFATSRYLRTIGAAPPLPQFDQMIALHDRESKADSDRVLA